MFPSPQMPSAPRPAPRVVPHPSWTAIARSSHDFTMTGTDFTSGDWVGRDPPLPKSEHYTPPYSGARAGEELVRWYLGAGDPASMYARMRGMSTHDLEEILRKWHRDFPLATGPLGQQLITRFMAGAGGFSTHVAGSELSEGLRNTGTYEDAKASVTRTVEAAVKHQAPSGTIDIARISFVQDMPFATASRDPRYSAKMRALVGGTKATYFYLRNFELGKFEAGGSWLPFSGDTFDWRAELHVVVTDHFGCDEDDLYQEGLIALWILQHQRTAKPFVLRMEIDDVIYGKL